MKINYPTLAVLSVLVLFAGLILTQPTLALAQEKASSVQGELTKVDAAAKTLSVKTAKGEMEFRYRDLLRRLSGRLRSKRQLRLFRAVERRFAQPV